MTDREAYSTGTTFEEQFGYNRAVRVGNTVQVAGTSPIEDGEVVAPGEPYEQASFVMDRIEHALEEVGASITDVIHTEVYVTDFGDWEEIGRAHREAFPDEQPASTMIAVNELPREGMVVEIKAEAVRE
ncbi:RidA family protein [Halovivax gelatinilyticus]|uniref:RidA family protein n=1 Tax=Halovivax gelatinilyticus TaxID=2961597 RepID=UPI0020CA2D18|nr:RidA family protein [Halovivax gelatinilyticus]